MTKPTDKPFWQAASPNPRAMWVFPVPLLPTAITFSRRATYSQRASSSTNVLLSEGIAGTLEPVQALDRREPRLLDAALDHPLFSVDQFEVGQAQQITRVVDAFGSALLGKLVVFAQEARQPECLQVMGDRSRAVSLTTSCR